MKLKSFTAGVLACALVAGTAAGCTVGADESWAAKTNSLTVPTGAYVYELYNAYSEGQSKATGADLKTAKIENQNALTWVNNRAKQLTNELFWLHDQMQALHLSLSSSETNAAKQMADNAWNQQFSSVLGDKHVSADSFKLAYATYTYQLRKVFEATYDKDGAKAIAEKDLENYFQQHYSDIDFTYIPLEKPGTSSQGAPGSGEKLTDAEKAALKKELDGYLAQIQAGKTTVQAASAAYAKAHNSTDNYQNLTENLDDSTVSASLPPDMIAAIKQMKAGETRLLDISSAYYVLVTKKDVRKNTAAFLKTSENRFKVLYAIKGTEFQNTLEKESKNYKGVTWNDAVLKHFTADLFYTAPSSSAAPAAPTSSAASSKAASAPASSAASSKAVSSAASSAASSKAVSSATASAASSKAVSSAASSKK